MNDPTSQDFTIRLIRNDDKSQITEILTKYWGSTKVISRGQIHEADSLPGFVAIRDNRKIGLITYHFENSECEIITLNSLTEGEGVGSALIAAVRDAAISEKCKRLWLITSNDNFQAIRFYQKRGFQLVAIHHNAINEYRELKPEIPKYGLESIPIQDEIEFEINLNVKRNQFYEERE